MKSFKFFFWFESNNPSVNIIQTCFFAAFNVLNLITVLIASFKLHIESFSNKEPIKAFQIIDLLDKIYVVSNPAQITFGLVLVAIIK